MLATTSYGKEIHDLDRRLSSFSSVLGAIDTRTLQERRNVLNSRLYRISRLEHRLAEMRMQAGQLVAEITGLGRVADAIGNDPLFDPIDPSRAARLHHKVDRLLADLAALDEEMESVEAELSTARADIRGNQASVVEAFEVCLAAAADAESKATVTRRDAAVRGSTNRQLDLDAPEEMWSPTAIVGYRAWDITDRGFKGAWQVWDAPDFSARCGSRDGVPHTNGTCSRIAYGCGVYAAKSLDKLIDEYGLDRRRTVAVGSVSLHDRVVEHESGYRAARARMEVLIVIEDGQVRRFLGNDQLEMLLRHPELRGLHGEVVAANARSTTEIRSALRAALLSNEEDNG